MDKIVKASWLYYGLAALTVWTCVDFDMLHTIRLMRLQVYLRSPKLENRIVLYDYLVHLNPMDKALWLKLAKYYALEGDGRDAAAALRKTGLARAGPT